MKGKRGRPRKAKSEQRSEFVPPFRMTKAELAKLKARAKAAGLRLSEYLRRAVMGEGHDQ
jgi:hypothetical protein